MTLDDPRIRFTAALVEELRGRAREDITLLPFLAPLIQGMRDGFDDQPAESPPAPPPSFDAVLPSIAVSEPLAKTLPDVARLTAWKTVLSEHPDVDPALQTGMHAAHIYGALGILGCERIRGGLFSLAPNIHYPLHTHVAAELYFCLGGTVTLRHGVDGAPFQLAGGDYSITPRERAHSLTTGDEPALIYFAWVGDFTAPIYWWEQDDAGIWHRARWLRGASGIWERGTREPVSEDQIAEQTLNRESDR